MGLTWGRPLALGLYDRSAVESDRTLVREARLAVADVRNQPLACDSPLTLTLQTEVGPGLPLSVTVDGASWHVLTRMVYVLPLLACRTGRAWRWTS